MTIGFIGAGKVGFSLGKYLANNGQSVSGYYSRNAASAKEAAKFTNSKFYDTLEMIVQDSEVLFVTVSDSAIEMVWNQLKELPLAGKIICHCSGVLSSEIFSDIANYNCYGYSIHPLLAVSDKKESYKEFSKTLFTIEGSKAKIDEMQNLFTSCGNRVRRIMAKDKIRYHGSAVLASNLVLGLLETATDELMKCGFEREEAIDSLVPLMLGNVEHLKHQTIEEALTGPAERNDISTIQKHLDVFEDEDKQIYRLLSTKAVSIAKRKNQDREYEKLEEILKNG